jgi:hypothetical protein
MLMVVSSIGGIAGVRSSISYRQDRRPLDPDLDDLAGLDHVGVALGGIDRKGSR